jgi:hypothetical protein
MVGTGTRYRTRYNKQELLSNKMNLLNPEKSFFCMYSAVSFYSHQQLVF